MKKLLLLFIMFVSFANQAAEQSNLGKVTFLTVGANYARIKLDNMKSVESCSEQDFYILDLTNGINREMYSALLSAKASNQTTYLLLSGCHLNKPRITHVYLKD